MPRFIDLIRQKPFLRGETGRECIVARQNRAEELLPELLEVYGMRLWRPGDAFASHGNRLLIGVSIASRYDLELLDLLAAHLARDAAAGISVDVFSWTSARTMEDFLAYIPGIGDVFQTPVVGAWTDGELTSSATGYEGRMLAGQVAGLPSDSFSRRLRGR
jgi:hypothetical protein